MKFKDTYKALISVIFSWIMIQVSKYIFSNHENYLSLKVILGLTRC